MTLTALTNVISSYQGHKEESRACYLVDLYFAERIIGAQPNLV